jgi:hypothetical protein
MDTSPSKEVKTPQHDGTPRSRIEVDLVVDLFVVHLRGDTRQSELSQSSELGLDLGRRPEVVGVGPGLGVLDVEGRVDLCVDDVWRWRRRVDGVGEGATLADDVDASMAWRASDACARTSMASHQRHRRDQ